MAVDPRNFLFNSDYEMDKIVYFKEGSITPAESHQAIDHGLSFTPLTFGVAAFTEDFSDPRMSPYTHMEQNGTISFQFFSNSTYINLNYSNTINPNQRLYYRIYAFEPFDSTQPATPTSSKAQKLILNTDYNYCKLYKAGLANSNATITHNLGYKPLVLAWDYPSQTAFFHWYNSPNSQIVVTNTAVSITSNSETYYRIYYDEA